MGAKFNNVHTVDEYIVSSERTTTTHTPQEADNFVEQIRWFMNFIVNVDESRDL